MSKRNRPTTAAQATHRRRRHAYRSAYNSPEGKAARGKGPPVAKPAATAKPAAAGKPAAASISKPAAAAPAPKPAAPAAAAPKPAAASASKPPSEG